MSVTRRAVLRALAAGGLGALAGTGAYGYSYGRHALELTRTSLPVADLPPALAGLRVGLLTDLHRSATVSHDDIQRAVALLMTERPDLIVLGGDYVTWGNRRYLGPAVEALHGLTAPHGVFAALGNHDDERELPAAMIAAGIAVLRDARTRLTVRGTPIELIGIRYWTKRAEELARLMRGAQGPIVLLAHDPRRLTEATALQIPLVLSGHTHGGQVVLPVVGALAAQRQRFPLLAGMARRNRTTIFVSRGVGTVYLPVRVNCPAEAALLTLAAATPA